MCVLDALLIKIFDEFLIKVDSRKYNFDLIIFVVFLISLFELDIILLQT